MVILWKLCEFLQCTLCPLGWITSWSLPEGRCWSLSLNSHLAKVSTSWGSFVQRTMPKYSYHALAWNFNGHLLMEWLCNSGSWKCFIWLVLRLFNTIVQSKWRRKCRLMVKLFKYSFFSSSRLEYIRNCQLRWYHFITCFCCVLWRAILKVHDNRWHCFTTTVVPEQYTHRLAWSALYYKLHEVVG